MTMITKILEPGKWRLRPRDGWHVIAVRLIGLRGRRQDLSCVTKEYFSRWMPELVKDTPVLRGTPIYFAYDPPFLLLWPAPAHTWKIEIDLREKIKVKA